METNGDPGIRKARDICLNTEENSQGVPVALRTDICCLGGSDGQ